MNKGQNKNLFQINEDEEEEPFSPSKNDCTDIQVEGTSHKKSVFGENKNIMNTSQMNNSNIHLAVNKQADYDCEINELPQFDSYSKNNVIDESNDKNL
jgi:hypothetical protein